MGPGYQALRGGAAWLDLSTRGRIVARGRDRARLLHAITTNEVKKMTAGTGCYAFLLNPQGRIQADLYLICLDDHFLIDTEPELREKVRLLIKRYIIADQVELEDVTAPTAAIGLEGPGAAAILAALGAPSPESPYTHAAWGDAMVAAVTVTGQPGARIFCPAEKAAGLVHQLEAARIAPFRLRADLDLRKLLRNPLQAQQRRISNPRQDGLAQAASPTLPQLLDRK